MMGILKKERCLCDYWLHGPFPHKIVAIAREAEATSLDIGYLRIGCEFQVWHDFAERMKAKEVQFFS